MYWLKQVALNNSVQNWKDFLKTMVSSLRQEACYNVNVNETVKLGDVMSRTAELLAKGLHNIVEES